MSTFAWRSFLSLRRVPHPLLLSHLRPQHRHERQLLTTALCSSSNPTNGGAEKKKKHLYVLLDDHKDGYGIHKLDIAAGADDNELRDQPPVLRVALPTIHEHAQFAAVGSSIVAMGACPVIYPKPLHDEEDDMGAVLIYDTDTAAMVVSPRLPEGLGCSYRVAIAVGEKELYVLESEWSSPHARRQYGGLHCLSAGKDDDEEEKPVWGWRRPLCWNDKLVLPFLTESNGIGAHAVVNRDILVSVNEWPYRGGAPVATTFSFDTATWQWTRRGDWGMPVVGHAHYDGEMDAWVGLHDGSDIGDTDGRLCAGDLTAAPRPEWKVGKEKLFRVEELDAAAGWRHVSAKLVPMAPGKYCLMERLRPGDDDDDKAGEEWLGDGDKCLLRLTAFRVERGEDGEPVATALRPARSYRVSTYNKDFDAQAFWM